MLAGACGYSRRSSSRRPGSSSAARRPWSRRAWLGTAATGNASARAHRASGRCGTCPARPPPASAGIIWNSSAHSSIHSSGSGFSPRRVCRPVHGGTVGIRLFHGSVRLLAPCSISASSCRRRSASSRHGAAPGSGGVRSPKGRSVSPDRRRPSAAAPINRSRRRAQREGRGVDHARSTVSPRLLRCSSSASRARAYSRARGPSGSRAAVRLRPGAGKAGSGLHLRLTWAYTPFSTRSCRCRSATPALLGSALAASNSSLASTSTFPSAVRTRRPCRPASTRRRADQPWRVRERRLGHELHVRYLLTTMNRGVNPVNPVN